MSRTPTLEFYYDLKSPWSYVAATRIEAIARRVNARVVWTPVRMDTIHEIDRSPQDWSSSMPPSKAAYYYRDLSRTMRRNNLALRRDPTQPVRTEEALRLLHATPEPHRAVLTRELYRLCWEENVDLTDRDLLFRTARRINIPYRISLDDKLFSDDALDRNLTEATARALERGAPGVPCVWVDNYRGGRLFSGESRLPLVEAAIMSVAHGVKLEQVPKIARVLHRCVQAPSPSSTPRRLTFWFDFASLYSYVAAMQLQRILNEAGPNVTIEYKPVLLAALFQKINSTSPILVEGAERQKKYLHHDFKDWDEFWNIVNKQADPLYQAPGNVTFPPVFPIVTIPALRVFLLEPKTYDCIFKACWIESIPIGASEKNLEKVLNDNGFDGAKLIQATKDNVDNVKDKLRKNVEEALALGIHGVPAFQVDGGEFVWGQDRLDVVQDLLAGWKPTDDAKEVPRL